MTIGKAISDLEGLTREFATTVNELSFPARDRSRIGAALLDQSHEHAASIVLLVSRGYTGAAFALLRCQFESAVRGFWVLRCASEEQIERFKEDKFELKARELIAEVESALGEENGILSRIKNEAWASLSSFVHGGFRQAVRRISEDSITPVYSEEEQLSILQFSRFCFFLAAVETCYVANDENLAISWARKY
ncbi:MAG: DUF6988 family protein [Wenzhouxiangella sp.]